MAQVLDPDTAAEDPNVPSRLDHWWRQVGEIECPSRAGDWHRASVQRLHDGRMVCLVSNITKAKLRDEKIAQANKMESLGKLTGGVAHEFNNLHFLLVDGTDQQNSGEKVGGPALKALQAAKRGAAITHGLLSYAHNQFLEPRTIDLVEIIGETLDILKPGLREDIQIGTHLTPDAWSPRVDAMHLQNALINIAVNAQEAMPNGGTLTFEVENVPSLDSHLRELAGDDVGDHVLVAVTDTGDGIAPDVLERVFEPFFTTKGWPTTVALG